jgi:hypothetical protein
MGCLFLAGFLTAIFVIFSGACKTLGSANPVTGRISLLISFILSAYITITVNRWDRIRNGTLGEYLRAFAYTLVTFPTVCHCS